MSGGFGQAIDQATVTAAIQGDVNAQATLYRLYGSAVFTLARRMLGDATAAEDVLQDSFLDAFDRLGHWRGDAPLGLWLRKIAVNRCLMHRRAHWQSRRDSLDGLADGQLPIPQAADSHAGHDLARLLDCLPPDDRMILWLKEVEGYSHADIAELFEQTVSFSKTRLARAHQRLRLHLGKEVATCTQAPMS